MAQLGHTDPKFTLRVYTHMMRRGSEERERLKALVAGERQDLRFSPPPAALGWPEYEMPILLAIAGRGGRASRREVLAALEAEMGDRFSAADRETHRDQPRWKINADIARRRLVQRGWLRSDSREGIWELSAAGVEYAPDRGDGVRRAAQDRGICSEGGGGSMIPGVVRSAPLIRARGKLERREGVINILVADLRALEWTDRMQVEVERIEPAAGGHEVGGADQLAARRRARELAVAELRAVVPTGHSFGRRGR